MDVEDGGAASRNESDGVDGSPSGCSQAVGGVSPQKFSALERTKSGSSGKGRKTNNKIEKRKLRKATGGVSPPKLWALERMKQAVSASSGKGRRTCEGAASSCSDGSPAVSSQLVGPLKRGTEIDSAGSANANGRKRRSGGSVEVNRGRGLVGTPSEKKWQSEGKRFNYNNWKAKVQEYMPGVRIDPETGETTYYEPSPEEMEELAQVLTTMKEMAK